MPLSRRDFVEQALVLTGAALAATPSPAPAEESPHQPTAASGGAGDKIRVAVIGVNGQGAAHVGEWLQTPEADVVAICDVDPGA